MGVRRVSVNDVGQADSSARERVAASAVYITVWRILEVYVVTNVFDLRNRRKQTSSSDKRAQDIDIDELKKSVTDDLRDQLLNECRRKHGIAKPKSE